MLLRGVKVYVIKRIARPVSERILWQYVGRVQTPTNSMKIHANKEANGDIQQLKQPFSSQSRYKTITQSPHNWNI
jgi:hypothetical protein